LELVERVCRVLQRIVAARRLIENECGRWVGQRVFGMALGYEDLTIRLASAMYGVAVLGASWRRAVGTARRWRASRAERTGS